MPVKHRFGASLDETRDLGLVPIRLSVTLRDKAGGTSGSSERFVQVQGAKCETRV